MQRNKKVAMLGPRRAQQNLNKKLEVYPEDKDIPPKLSKDKQPRRAEQVAREQVTKEIAEAREESK